ncbi:MAG: ABC transporter ATP-binding protein [Flavobacteriales bacterium]|jgi:iron complex transport system ATP-binding protein
MKDHTALHIDAINAGFGEKKILRGATLVAEKGQITAIQGRNGSGKSTLLRCIAGIIPVQSGRITQGKNDLSLLSPIQRSAIIGAVWTDRTRIAGLTVQQLLEMGAFNGAWVKTGMSLEEHIQHTLELFRLTPIAHQSSAEISDGQLQLTMLARAIAQCAEFLLLDEPTTYLDYIAKEELMQILKDLAAHTGTGIILTSHDPALSQVYAHKTYELTEGILREV